MLNRYDDDILDVFELLDEEIRQKEDAENSLSAFIWQAWHVIEPGDEYIHNWHMDAIAEHLEAITNGQINRLLINIPPGCMKSLMLNVFWPAWEWGPKKMAHLRHLSLSHRFDLSIRDNIIMRRLVKSEWYQKRYPHVSMRKDQDSTIKFSNTQNGFKEAMAIASATGSRAHRLGIDDPISVDDAQSKVVLAKREITFTESLPTRMVSPKESAIVVIMQRVDDRDISGVILARKLGYTHLMLPMEFEVERRCTTSLGFVDPRTYDGELLFPGRFPQEVVDRDKEVLGSHAIAGQFQQRPSPREGSIIKIDWMKQRFDIPRDGFGNLQLHHFKEIFQSWDTAFKEGQENDFSCCLTWGLRDNGFYLIDRYKKRVGFPQLEDDCIALAAKYKPNQLLIEDKASGQSLGQALKRRTRLPFKMVQPVGDKTSRLHSSSGYIESGRVFLPNNETWVDEYVTTMTTFPTCKHDDEVDATTQFIMEIGIRREASINFYSGSIMGR